MKLRPWLAVLAVGSTFSPAARPAESVSLRPAAPAVASSGGAVDRLRLKAMARAAERELRGNILPFWLTHAPDRAHGGFHAFIGEDMVVRDDQPRGALLTTRILWAFSAAYRRFHDPAYLALARYAYRDLTDRFQDKLDGGYYWTISADGRPLDSHKQVYGQVFVIYALAEYFQATGDPAALAEAVKLYGLIDTHARDPVHGGYFDALTRDWRHSDRPGTNLLGEAPKSQNSHIHILESFTNLLRVWPDPGLRARQRELIQLTFHRIIDARTHHLVLFMQDDWTPIGDHVSYGHDIELSWLLVEATEVIGDPALVAQAKAEAVAIARVTEAEGVDRDGGVYNEGDPQGPTNTNKEWWEQAEATVGFLNAYQISGDPRFFAWSRRSWDFIRAKVVDHEHGDWHNTLRRDGTPILSYPTAAGGIVPSAKLSLWKCPYHNTRACLELMTRLDALAAATPAP